ncbi:MAG: NADH-quinone oxidoreductase subunit N, partial [Rubrobacter sp.]|nr:NADH-quinone oxidoreductase subunit N [Rubrobacter sp.]
MMALLQGMQDMQGMDGGTEMQMGRDLALLAPQLAVVLTAVGALVLEMLRLPRVALPFTVIGLLVATALVVPLLGTETTVFMDTYRIDSLSLWAALTLAPTTALCAVLAYPE